MGIECDGDMKVDDRRFPNSLSFMDDLERSHLAAQFLLQSPPGEINDVLNGPLTDA